MESSVTELFTTAVISSFCPNSGLSEGLATTSVTLHERRSKLNTKLQVITK